MLRNSETCNGGAPSPYLDSKGQEESQVLLKPSQRWSHGRGTTRSLTDPGTESGGSWGREPNLSSFHPLVSFWCLSLAKPFWKTRVREPPDASIGIRFSGHSAEQRLNLSRMRMQMVNHQAGQRGFTYWLVLVDLNHEQIPAKIPD